MKKLVWDNGIGFVGGGLLAMAISLWQGLSPFWIGLISVVVGIMCMIISHYFYGRIKKFLNQTIRGFITTLKVIFKTREASGLLTLIEQQRENPEKWLHPVIEYIDLNRQGSAHDDNDVYVKFQIDSHLLFSVNEFYVFVKLYLAPDSVHSNESEWYEIKQAEHYAPIMRLERHIFSEERIHLEGETVGEKLLLEWVQDFRNNKPLLAMLKVGIKFEKNDEPIVQNLNVLEGNGSRYIAPMNDYRRD